jgi:hypothetical protein
VDQAICGGSVAAGRYANPIGRRRKDFDTVIPARRGHSFTHHFGEFEGLERSRDVTEGSLAHGRNDVSSCPLIREDNQTDMRARTPDFVKKLHIFLAESLPSSHDQVEWLGRCPSESMLIVNSVLNRPAFTGQNAGK